MGVAGSAECALVRAPVVGDGDGAAAAAAAFVVVAFFPGPVVVKERGWGGALLEVLYAIWTKTNNQYQFGNKIYEDDI